MLKIIKVRAAWGTTLGQFSGNYFYYFLLAWLPRYLVEEDHISVLWMSRLTSGLFLLIGVATLLAGWLSDRLIARGVAVSAVRRAMAGGGLTLASCVIATALVPNHQTSLFMGLLALGSIGYGAFCSNHWAVAQTLAGPSMAGRWSSLQNGVANFSGIVAPWVAGLVLHFQGNSRLAFSVSGVVTLAGASGYAFLVKRVEPVDWEAV